MTEKLFYTDSHMQEFTAEVVSCRPCDNGYEAVLSRTAFFPEGGGQAADTGVIDGIRVYDVQEKGDQIFHYLEGELEGKDRDRSDRLGQTFFTDAAAQRRTYRIGNRSCTFWI